MNVTCVHFLLTFEAYYGYSSRVCFDSHLHRKCILILVYYGAKPYPNFYQLLVIVRLTVVSFWSTWS